MLKTAITQPFVLLGCFQLLSLKAEGGEKQSAGMVMDEPGYIFSIFKQGDRKQIPGPSLVCAERNGMSLMKQLPSLR